MLPCCPRRTPTAWTRVVDRPGDRAAGAAGLDDLVDDADLDGLVDAAGDPLVLGGQLGLDLRPDLGGDLGELAPVQDPDRGDRRPSPRPRRPATRSTRVAPSERAFIAM